jgi:magnesium-transporting ATPase (P-type)
MGRKASRNSSEENASGRSPELAGPPWALEAEAVLSDLEVEPERGLSAGEVEGRRKQFGSNRLERSRRNALINRLSAVETLGATTGVCADKTGTLTENRMRLRCLELATGTAELTGEGTDAGPGDDTLLRQALEVGALCNNASLADGEDKGLGDPLEVALLQAAVAAGIDRDDLLEKMPEVREEAFSTENMMMATIHENGKGFRVAVKGAPEAVLETCSSLAVENGTAELTDEDRRDCQERNRRMAEAGLRVVALPPVRRGDWPADGLRPQCLFLQGASAVGTKWPLHHWGARVQERNSRRLREGSVPPTEAGKIRVAPAKHATAIAPSASAAPAGQRI